MLRDLLFQRYFQIENGILVSELTEKLSFIPETWRKLHILCENNLKHFNSLSTLEKCKIVEHHQKKYLILKLRIWRYVIIDLDKMRNITKNEFENEFDEEFFVNNFDEIKEDNASIYSSLYEIEQYKGDIQELVNFYIENQDVLCLTTKIHYKLDVGKAWTWFHIDLVNANAQMGFQTQDKILYEQLFLKYDLTPWEMQDAGRKMGIEKMQEILSKIKEVKIPIECIPRDLYQQYLIQCNADAKELILKKCKLRF